MKKTILLLAILSGNNFSFAQKQKIIAKADANCMEEKWTLEFEDNFDGNNLDLNKWKNREYSQGSFENEGSSEYYTLDNIKVENGICKIIPKKETIIRKAVSWKADSLILQDGKINTRQYDYTSGWIETKQYFHYGKFEIRCKIPKGKSMWPAFWMYGEKDRINNEIDVFEFWNPTNSFGKYTPKKLSKIHHMTIHYNKKMSGKKYEGEDFSKDFHTFTVVWDSTKIEWFVDGQLKRTSTYYQTKRGKDVDCKDVKAGNTYYLNPIFPNEKMAILANLALQSGKNSPDENTFNSVFEIDYIRYYKTIK